MMTISTMPWICTFSDIYPNRSTQGGSERESKKRISFLVKESGKAVCVFSKDIVFVEIAGRSTRVVTTQGEYNSENGIDFWDSKLAAPSFFRVHKSYIVNVHYATDYTRATVVLCGKYEIPIAYRKQAEFRHFFLNYFGGR